jgi:hypothetical protein
MKLKSDSVPSRLCENAVIGFQPEGLSDSSRWSQRSGDHRKGVPTWSVPRRGASVFLTPVPGVELFKLSGGLRYAATTGYYLTALQAERYVKE